MALVPFVELNRNERGLPLAVINGFWSLSPDSKSMDDADEVEDESRSVSVSFGFEFSSLLVLVFEAFLELPPVVGAVDSVGVELLLWQALIGKLVALGGGTVLFMISM